MTPVSGTSRICTLFSAFIAIVALSVLGGCGSGVKFGGLALLLATVGLYGVTSYTVARRTSEIGIRMALGAERGGVVAMILRSALLQTLLGLAIGVPVAFYGVQLVKSQLYEMKTVSVGALAVAVGTLLVAACVAGAIPARRAASVDPAKALRSE